MVPTIKNISLLRPHKFGHIQLNSVSMVPTIKNISLLRPLVSVQKVVLVSKRDCSYHVLVVTNQTQVLYRPFTIFGEGSNKLLLPTQYTCNLLCVCWMYACYKINMFKPKSVLCRYIIWTIAYLTSPCLLLGYSEVFV